MKASMLSMIILWNILRMRNRIKIKPRLDPLRKTLISPKSIPVLGATHSHFTSERMKLESL